MRPLPDKPQFRPLSHLGRLVESKKLALKERPAPLTPKPGLPSPPQKEAEIFKKAMADVTPLAFDRHWQWPKHQPVIDSVTNDEEQQTVEALQKLVSTGLGFCVADTSEYMEATSPGIHPLIAQHLHQGRYSVQDHIDLHGFTARKAKEAVHNFVIKAVMEGKRAVLVVHGRGLTSPQAPVLKHKVYQWLTRGPLRKHVIAITSARSCDGGAGATYVLLRVRPMTKSMRKSKKDM